MLFGLLRRTRKSRLEMQRRLHLLQWALRLSKLPPSTRHRQRPPRQRHLNGFKFELECWAVLRCEGFGGVQRRCRGWSGVPKVATQGVAGEASWYTQRRHRSYTEIQTLSGLCTRGYTESGVSRSFWLKVACFLSVLIPENSLKPSTGFKKQVISIYRLSSTIY